MMTVYTASFIIASLFEYTFWNKNTNEKKVHESTFHEFHECDQSRPVVLEI